MTYQPPVQDMLFLINDVLGFEGEGLDRDTQEQILSEASSFASEVLAPLNYIGDRVGCVFKDGEVTTPPGFADAYAQYRDGGWNALAFAPDYGGQGLPYALSFAVQEMWQGANMSFGLCPLLNQGAVEAIAHHGSAEQKQTYLPKLVSGEWAGTMNLTEPQAGSDLGLIASRAVPHEEGSYKIFGQKIFITYGEHDFTSNIIHLVLARLPDAPPDVKGISLFIVPKFLSDGTRNDVKCTGLEHKLGIHASPTCTMQFGDAGGATGYLVGQKNEGLKYMFTMMNNARLSVGLQGVAIAERALQKALSCAAERVQGKPLSGGQERVTIDRHAEIRRMLLTMKAFTQGSRALTYLAAKALDDARAGDSAAQARVDLLTPLVKAWCTDNACEVASLGVQVHGGMGFIEETGAAQYMRDARILPIYEGTNGIQALDLVFRKLGRDEGMAAAVFVAELEAMVRAQDASHFAPAFAALKTAVTTLVQNIKLGRLDQAAFVAAPFLRGFAMLAAGALLSRGLAALEGNNDPDFVVDKREAAQFYFGFLLPQATASLLTAQNPMP